MTDFNYALLAVPVLGIGLVVVTYLSNYYYKQAHRMKQLGAKNALMYFYVQRDVGNLVQALGPLPCAIPGLSYEELESYEAAIGNARRALENIHLRHAEYGKAAALVVGNNNG